MNTSKKITTIILSLIGFAGIADAQTTTSQTPSTPNSIIYSIGADGGFAAGSFKHANKWDVGGSLQVDVPIATSLFFTANAGYLNFFGKKDFNGTGQSAPDIHLLPVKAGLKYFVAGIVYAQAEAGAAFALNKSDVGYTKTAAFLYTPQLGILLPLSGKSYLDAGAYYEASTKFSNNTDNTKVNFFGVRLAYAFSVK